MLKSIKLKNFSSFANLEADFTMDYGNPKKLVIIYGENGSGKTNLISSIVFLKDTFYTLSFQEHLNKLMETDNLEEYNGDLRKILFKFGRYNLLQSIKQHKMIDSTENMVLEFDYIYSNSKEAIYRMEFNDEKIIYESFYCQLEKNLVKTFEIIDDKPYFNSNLFPSEKYEKEIREKIRKYFGRHSFLAIMFNELSLNNKKYMNENVAKSFLEAIDELYDCSVWRKHLEFDEGFISTSKIMFNLTQGNISKTEISNLKRIQEALNNYFVSLYPDIKSVYYGFEEENSKIKYELYFDKLINDKIRSIPYSLESSGTKKLLDIFPYIYKCLKSGTVFIDEIDSGVHDLLMSHLLTNLENHINGQLIITTHNTILLKKIKSDYCYVINVDSNGNKTLNCVRAFGRIQNNHNVALRYLNGTFGGVPHPGYIDFKEIISSIDKMK